MRRVQQEKEEAEAKAIEAQAQAAGAAGDTSIMEEACAYVRAVCDEARGGMVSDIQIPRTLQEATEGELAVQQIQACLMCKEWLLHLRSMLKEDTSVRE